MHNDNKAGDDQRTKSEVHRLFAEGRIDPNRATAQLLELDRRRRQTERPRP